MTDQDTRFNPLDHGLIRRVVERDAIDQGQWLRAHAEQAFVGTCRLCTGYLTPSTPQGVGQVTWYEARCILCGHEIASPGGRVLRRSARRSEQPVGWWEYRTDRLIAEGPS